MTPPQNLGQNRCKPTLSTRECRTRNGKRSSRRTVTLRRGTPRVEGRGPDAEPQDGRPRTLCVSFTRRRVSGSPGEPVLAGPQVGTGPETPVLAGPTGRAGGVHVPRNKGVGSGQGPLDVRDAHTAAPGGPPLPEEGYAIATEDAAPGHPQYLLTATPSGGDVLRRAPGRPHTVDAEGLETPGTVGPHGPRGLGPPVLRPPGRRRRVWSVDVTSSSPWPSPGPGSRPYLLVPAVLVDVVTLVPLRVPARLVRGFVVPTPLTADRGTTKATGVS